MGYRLLYSLGMNSYYELDFKVHPVDYPPTHHIVIKDVLEHGFLKRIVRPSFFLVNNSSQIDCRTALSSPLVTCSVRFPEEKDDLPSHEYILNHLEEISHTSSVSISGNISIDFRTNTMRIRE